MPRVRDSKVILYLTEEQKTDLDARAQASGLSVPNYLRSLLGWPLERQGARKDLMPNGGQEWTDEQKP
jgi:hypothetical protein